MAILTEISERLITLGGKTYQLLTEFLQHSEIEEEEGEFRNVERKLGTCSSDLSLPLSSFSKKLWM